MAVQIPWLDPLVDIDYKQTQNVNIGVDMESAAGPLHFIEQIIEKDLQEGRCPKGVVTRFPPEPNGYLHIGHAKAICLDFGMAAQYQGRCHLRFDDTNPAKEDVEYTRAIQEDVRWLGFQWDELCFASNYFQQFYEFAVQLIEKDLAYVCHLSMDEIRNYRGTLTEPGKESPYRNRSIAENLDLFKRMKAGEFPDGHCVLRAKIDMKSGNLNMRDPIMYRILKMPHPHIEEVWNIYPLYDYAHCVSDAIEGITHSLCTLEFQDHRPLYDWYLDHLFPEPRSHQYEFSRLNLTHTLTSKRKLKALVDEGKVSGWDDPRMPTLVGLRRRGFTPAGIREFCQRIGISKSDSVIDMSVLEECVRDDLNQHAARAMCVLDPLEIIIENYPENKEELLEVAIHPQRPELGTRVIKFGRRLLIERDDFMFEPSKNYFRLAPGKEVRLRHAYIIACKDVIRDPKTQAIQTIICQYDPDTLGKNPVDRKVKGVIHWVNPHSATACEVRLYDRLFQVENPSAVELSDAVLNPHSLTVLPKCYLDWAASAIQAEQHFQFERNGYFVADRHDCHADLLVFNRVVALRDSWQKT
jgi:glutaminyl-tRNA synthetase